MQLEDQRCQKFIRGNLHFTENLQKYLRPSLLYPNMEGRLNCKKTVNWVQ